LPKKRKRFHGNVAQLYRFRSREGPRLLIALGAQQKGRSITLTGFAAVATP
jgi:hypothetical protein